MEYAKLSIARNTARIRAVFRRFDIHGAIVKTLQKVCTRSRLFQAPNRQPFVPSNKATRIGDSATQDMHAAPVPEPIQCRRRIDSTRDTARIDLSRGRRRFNKPRIQGIHNLQAERIADNATRRYGIFARTENRPSVRCILDNPIIKVRITHNATGQAPRDLARIGRPHNKSIAFTRNATRLIRGVNRSILVCHLQHRAVTVSDNTTRNVTAANKAIPDFHIANSAILF